MVWSPLTRSKIVQYIREGECHLDKKQRRVWDVVRIEPVKWQQHPWGDDGDGFWVVGIYGQHVLWYNDIEEGFEVTTYSQFGKIDEYGADQFELRHVISRLQVELGMVSS
jgi:hypothetical protein